MSGYHRVTQVIQRPDPPNPADQIFLTRINKHATGGIDVRCRNCVENLPHAQVILAQQVGVNLDLILFGFTAIDQHLGHAGDRS